MMHLGTQTHADKKNEILKFSVIPKLTLFHVNTMKPDFTLPESQNLMREVKQKQQVHYSRVYSAV